MRSRICCISKRHAPCTYQVLKLITSTDGSLDQKIKALVVGSFFPLCFPTACICDLAINSVRICKPNFFRDKEIKPKFVRKIQKRSSISP